MNRNLIFALILSLLMPAVVHAQEGVSYYERSWDEDKKELVSTLKTVNVGNYVLMSAGDGVTWQWIGGDAEQNYRSYYVVSGNVTRAGLEVRGESHLILMDGARLTVTEGIKVCYQSDNHATLHVHSQSYGESQGQLIVTQSHDNATAIGGYKEVNCGTIIFHGGYVEARGGKYAAGIGGGTAAKDGTTIVYGGHVKAWGGDSGAGIGGGANNLCLLSGAKGGTFKMYDGKVYAEGGEYAAGIGGSGSYHNIVSNRFGKGGAGGDVSIYGGELTAQGGRRGAGIGTGSCDYSKNGGPTGGTLTVRGGTVVANGGAYGAGIGGGCNASGGKVYMYAGSIYAKGGKDGAGIGGGEDGNGGTVKIYGGYIRAEGNHNGAGIGGGDNTRYTTGAGGNVKFVAGVIEAIAGDNTKGREEKGGSAIGGGKGIYKNTDSGFVDFDVNLRVTAGDAPDNVERVFTKSERWDACRWRNYAKLELCDHATPEVGSDKGQAMTYSITPTEHTHYCRFCGFSETAKHSYDDENKCVCGKTFDVDNDMYDVTIYSATAAGTTNYAQHIVMKVVKGTSFTIPEIPATKGMTVQGYLLYQHSGSEPITEHTGIEMTDSEIPYIHKVGEVFTPENNITLYARYRYNYSAAWTWAADNKSAAAVVKCADINDERNLTATIYTNLVPVDDNTEDVGTVAEVSFQRAEGVTYTLTDRKSFYTRDLISMFDNRSIDNYIDNEERLEELNGNLVHKFKILGRTLYKDGYWNTLCLPFDIDQSTMDNDYFMKSATIMVLSSSSYDETTSTLTLNFTTATAVKAGTPMLIKWEASTPSYIYEPVFTDVLLNNCLNNGESDNVLFTGNYSPLQLSANDRGVLYLSGVNTLYYPDQDKTIGAFRGIFLLQELSVEESTNEARNILMNFGDESTGIANVERHTPAAGYWFTMDGRRLPGEPTHKGIYIRNGRKVVIK